MTIFRLSRRAGFNVSGSVRTLGNVGTATPPPPPPSAWDVGNIVVTEGATGTAPGQFDVSATGPSGAPPGGVYGAASGLPAGMSVDAAGVLDVGTAAAGVNTGTIFSYSEALVLPTLTLYPAAVGLAPIMATAFPLEGAVPAGQTVLSPDEPTLRGSVTSTWPDGSAQVVVLAGQRNFTSTSPVTINLRAGAPSGTVLTDARVQALVTSITADFGGGVQMLDMSTAVKDFTWWANPQVICNRYRLLCGHTNGKVEAIIDIHAFAANFAFVEVVIENGKITSSNALATKPTNAAYTAAVVTVNGTPITPSGGVNSSSGPVGTHEPFRAWYCSTWVGSSTPAIDPVEVTHNVAHLQAHPLFWKSYTAHATTLAPYAAAPNYTPWCTIWHVTNTGDMASPGESGRQGLPSESSTWIGYVAGFEAPYILTGDKGVRKAIIVAGLEALRLGSSYRESTTNLVPDCVQMGTKTTNANTWPEQIGRANPSGNNTFPSYELAHSASPGMMAFLCRPSPCFIEIAQGLFGVTRTINSFKCQYGYQQVRGRAWATRNYMMALFLTPDAAPFTTWKSSARTDVEACHADIDGFRTKPWNTLGVIYGLLSRDNLTFSEAQANWDDSSLPRQQVTDWEIDWYVQVANAMAAVKIVRDPVKVAAWKVNQDFVNTARVKWINTNAQGQWRYSQYKNTFGDVTNTTPPTVNMGTGRWDDMMATEYSAGGTISPPTDTSPNPGTFLSIAQGGTYPGGPSGIYAHFIWYGISLVKEYGVAGADTAQARVVANIDATYLTNLLNVKPRYNIAPRL